MKVVLAASLLVLMAMAAQVLAAQKEGYCGYNNWHHWSPCGDRQKYGEYMNDEPIICFKDFPGYQNHSRHCVEGLLCVDKSCDMATGNRDTCYGRIVNECRSLGLYKESTSDQ